MLIPQAPIEPPINTNQINDVQAAEQLQRGDIKQIIKEIFLRHLINGTIKENERADVTTGVTIQDMQSGRTIMGHNQDEIHFAASVNKLPIALLVLEELRAGNLTLDQVVSWQASDQRGGFGDFDQPGAPLQGTVEDLLYDMLNRSGNTVVRALVNYTLGGAVAVNERFAEKPGLQNTSLTPFPDGSFWLGDSTTRDSMWAMDELISGGDQYSTLAKDMMSSNIFTDFGVRSQLNLDKDYIVLVNKIGLLDDPDGNNRHDTGIIYNTKTGKRYGFSIFTTADYENTDGTQQANESLKTMGDYLLRFADDRHQRPGNGNHSLKQLQLPVEKRIKF